MTATPTMTTTSTAPEATTTGSEAPTAGLLSTTDNVYQSLGVVLGAGKCSLVLLGYELSTGQAVALKVTQHCRSNEDVSNDKNNNSDASPHLLAMQEWSVLERLQPHPNILRALDVPMHLVADGHYQTVLPLELCDGGTLLDYVQSKGRLHETEAQLLMLQLVTAIAHAHSVGIVHRDIKLENLLLHKHKEASPYRLKVADWGMAASFRAAHTGGDVIRLQGCCSSVHYCAPEMTVDAEYGPEVDSWSCGVVLYAMLTGEFPWQGGSVAEVQTCARRFNYPPLPDSTSASCKDLLRRLLRLDPTKRICAGEALQHAWLVPNTVDTLTPHCSASS